MLVEERGGKGRIQEHKQSSSFSSGVVRSCHEAKL